MYDCIVSNINVLKFVEIIYNFLWNIYVYYINFVLKISWGFLKKEKRSVYYIFLYILYIIKVYFKKNIEFFIMVIIIWFFFKLICL